MAEGVAAGHSRHGHVEDDERDALVLAGEDVDRLDAVVGGEDAKAGAVENRAADVADHLLIVHEEDRRASIGGIVGRASTGIAVRGAGGAAAGRTER